MGWYIGPAIELYICYKSYTPKTRSKNNSDTVEFSPKTFNMPKVFYTDTKIHAAQDLIHALHHTATDIPLVTLGNAHKETLISITDIFVNAISPSIPHRVPVRGAYQEKLNR